MESLEKELEAYTKSKGWYDSFTVCERGHRSKRTLSLHAPEDHLTSYVHGLNGRPAVVLADMNTGIVLLEEWRINVLHRDEGPARIRRDPVTGVVVEQGWYSRGYLDRKDGPALVKYDRVTGDVIYESYREKGHMISEQHFPENEQNATRRQLGARARWARERANKLDSPKP